MYWRLLYSKTCLEQLFWTASYLFRHHLGFFPIGIKYKTFTTLIIICTELAAPFEQVKPYFLRVVNLPQLQQLQVESEFGNTDDFPTASVPGLCLTCKFFLGRGTWNIFCKKIMFSTYKQRPGTHPVRKSLVFPTETEKLYLWGVQDPHFRQSKVSHKRL